MSVEAERAQAEMIAALQRRLAARGTVRLIETHISWVLLFGRKAYSISTSIVK